MHQPPATLPDAVPVLSRGKHRNPRKGGCFMEFASMLAGEPWSDHPRCTHPLLAALAREVNDSVSDETRRRIARLIPDVIGLTGDDPLIEVMIAVRSAAAALPMAPYERQRSLAVALLRCERELAGVPGALAHELRILARSALQSAPSAKSWARDFTTASWGGVQDFSRTAQHIVHLSVSGISASCSPANDLRLCELLEQCLEETRELLGQQVSTPAASAPRAVAELANSR